MLPLSLTTDKLSIITSSTAPIDVITGFIDRNQSTGVVGLAERQLTAIVTATTTDVVAVPGATTTRNVTFMSIRNKHASTSNDVTVQFNANGTLFELYKTTLLAGETLMYIDIAGFFKIGNVTRLERSFNTASDQTFATAATFADITGLTCPLLAGRTYCVLAHIYHINNATTTGSQFAYNIGAAPTLAQFATIDTVTASVTASVHSSGGVTARDTALTAQTTGSIAIVPAIISGVIIPSADGTFAMRATSEVTVASGLITKAGSWMRIWEPTL